MDNALINPNILIKILIEQFYCVIELVCFRPVVQWIAQNCKPKSKLF